MTLSIMLTSRSSVYLTGDFRLTDKSGHKLGDKDDLNVQKLVPTFKCGWTALVAHTGVAKTNRGLDVGDWVSAKLQAMPLDAKFEELPKALLTADHWLGQIVGYRKLAFAIVGFVRRRPVAMVISNFLDMNGNEYSKGSPKLKRFEIRPKLPEVRVIGDTRDITTEQRNSLKRLLIQKKHPREIQAALAEVNASAARARDLSFISPECVTGYLLPTGDGEITPHGINDRVAYIPGFVNRHFDIGGIDGFSVRMDERGQPLPPRWVGMSMKVQQNVVVNMHAIRNVKEPIGPGPTDPNQQAFWKVAGKNEAPYLTLSFQENPKRHV